MLCRDRATRRVNYRGNWEAMLGETSRNGKQKDNGRSDRPEPGRSRTGGIILAGMHSWGNMALESIMCRPLLPVACRPLILHVADWLRRGGVDDAVVCGNSDTNSIRRRLGERHPMDLRLRYYEDVMPRGPAGCMRDAAERNDSDAFVVVEGAILPQIDLGELLTSHRNSGAALTLVVTDAAGKEGSRKGSREGAMEPVGIYVVSPAALEHVPMTGYQDIKESLIPTLYESGERVTPYRVSSERAPRVTGAWSYLSANMHAVQNIGTVMNGNDKFKRMGEAWVHRTAEVSASARLVGPVLVSAESTISGGALVVGPTAIGEQTSIQSDSVISRTIVWERCTIGTGAVIDHSILTAGTNVKPGRVIRNTICVPQNGKRRAALGRLASKPGLKEKRKRNGDGSHRGARQRSSFRGNGVPRPTPDQTSDRAAVEPH